MRLNSTNNTNLVFMLRHKNLPILTNCTLIKIISKIEDKDGKTLSLPCSHIYQRYILSGDYYNFFISPDIIANRTGAWYMGVMSFAQSVNVTTAVKDEASCSAMDLNRDMLEYDLRTNYYVTRIYTSGCYFFNKTSEIWEAGGIRWVYI